jgi:RNA polymerase subunit RPABC4/transcription elongation factor Spt4
MDLDQILDPIFDAIGGFFSNPIVQFGLWAIAAYVVILWFAAAYWAFRDMQLRTENPILPYLAATLIVLFSPILFPFGLVVYRIIRPQERIGDVYERNLAEEALLAEVEAIRSCPACARRVHEDWIICPSCRTRLNRVCPNCGRLVGLDWSLCAWCGKDFERSDLAALEPIAGGLSDTDRIDAPAAHAGLRASVGRAAAVRPTAVRSAAHGPSPRSAGGPVPEP